MNKDIRSFFDYLNEKCNYIVLRNWDNIFNGDLYSEGHEDIDILCDSLEKFVALTKAERIHQERNRDNFIVSLEATKIRIDVRWVGDGYYPKEMERAMLQRRVFDYQGIFIPERKDFYFSLAYHAFIQKPQLSVEYERRLNSLRDSVSDVADSLSYSVLLEELRNYMISNSWKVEYPNDPGVFLNPRVMKLFPVEANLFRVANRSLFIIKRTVSSSFGRLLRRIKSDF